MDLIAYVWRTLRLKRGKERNTNDTRQPQHKLWLFRLAKPQMRHNLPVPSPSPRMNRLWYTAFVCRKEVLLLGAHLEANQYCCEKPSYFGIQFRRLRCFPKKLSRCDLDMLSTALNLSSLGGSRSYFRLYRGEPSTPPSMDEDSLFEKLINELPLLPIALCGPEHLCWSWLQHLRAVILTRFRWMHRNRLIEFFVKWQIDSRTNQVESVI